MRSRGSIIITQKKIPIRNRIDLGSGSKKLIYFCLVPTPISWEDSSEFSRDKTRSKQRRKRQEFRNLGPRTFPRFPILTSSPFCISRPHFNFKLITPSPLSRCQLHLFRSLTLETTVRTYGKQVAGNRNSPGAESGHS